MTSGYSGEVTAAGDAAGAPAAGADLPGDSGLIAIANVLLHYRRLIVLCVVLVTAAVVGMTLAEARTYTSTASFMPHVSGGSLAGLSNLAAQLGVNVGKEDPTQSPDFYAEVIKSRDVLTSLATAKYAVRGPARVVQGTLADVLDLDAKSPPQRLEDALKHLQRMIFVNVTRQTGIMHVNVTTTSPELSQQLADHLLHILDDFNTRMRQNQAGAEEQFLQQQELEARIAHDAAEERVVNFLRSNRTYERDPSLSHDYSRLSQAASSSADVLATLTKARAQARIEAARNTPVITVLDHPSMAIHPDGRGLLRSGLLALVLGFLLGTGIASVGNVLRSKEEDEQTRQFAELRAQALEDLRHPIRALRPRRTPSSRAL